MSDPTQQIFEALMGFTAEFSDKYIIFKIEKDALVKKILAQSRIYEKGAEYAVDDKYVIIKIPVYIYGKEALKDLGVTT